MLKFFLSKILIIFSITFGFSQNVLVNYDINPEVYKVSDPLNLWLDFLNTKDDFKGSKYWNENEVKKYGSSSYFLIEKALNFGEDNYLQLLSYAKIKVLSVKEIDKYYKITSLMEFPEKNNKSNIHYIFHVYAALEKGKLKLFNPLTINTKLILSSTTVGFIKFHYLKEHNFNYNLAKKQNDFLVKLSNDFEVSIDTIDYYFAPTTEQIQKIKGFDYYIGSSGKEVPSGRADPENRIVYSTGLGEYYPHEFIHILLNPKYPNCHLWINEGVATYFGMSRGKDLNWHLNRLKEHLKKQPEINLNNMLELRTLDQYTDYRYVLGGFIIKKAFEKGGYDLIKVLMNSGKKNNELYQALNKYLGMKRENLNQYIRKELDIR